MFRERRFRTRRRWRWWAQAKKKRNRGLLTRLMDWWNRRRFYTFHKDEIITQQDTCPSPLQIKNSEEDEEEEVEWNNESESEDPDQNSDTASKNDGRVDDKVNETCEESDLESDEGADTLVTIEEESVLEDSPRLGSKPKITLSPPKGTPAPPLPLTSIKNFQNRTENFQNRTAVDSLSGSLESMDSLVSSGWDPEDDASTITPLITNTHPTSDAFFVEHVRFLQIQTQPRKVEEVYHNVNKEKPAKE